MRKFALVNNNIVTEIKTLTEDDYRQETLSNQTVVDIEDITPQPMINWVLNGNKLEFPQGGSEREILETALAEEKITFGIQLARKAVVKIGVRNKILNKNGEQVSLILNSLLPIKLLLETGALGTARFACLQLKNVYTEYSDIFQSAVDDINFFESKNGL